ncbi:MAG: S8 family serine peptidase, partial [Bacteroidia bacterium]
TSLSVLKFIEKNVPKEIFKDDEVGKNSMIDSLKFRVTGYSGIYDYRKDSFDSVAFYRTSKWIVPGKLIEDSFYEELYYKGFFEVGSVVEAAISDLNQGSKHRMFILQIDDKADIDLRQNPPKANGLDLFKIDVEGSATFNSWLMAVSYTYSGSLARFALNPQSLGAPTIANYQVPNNNFSIISPAVYKETFAVGSYVNLWQYYDVLGQRQPPRWARKPSGSLSTFSSKGPSVDGRTLPEITAPGQNVISAIPDYYSGWSPKVKDGTYAVSSGTSMSTPVVAGAVALYLEQNPNATLADVRKAFLNNTHEDEHTNSNGGLPNNYWGFGKLDVYRVMSGGIFFSQKELNNSGINIYPNPTSNILIIEDEFVEATILSINGKGLIKCQTSQIDVSGLKSGTYLIRIEQENQIVNARFVVSK